MNDDYIDVIYTLLNADTPEFDILANSGNKYKISLPF